MVVGTVAYLPTYLPTWDLLDLVVLEDIATIDGLELQIPRHLGVQQDLDQLAARHNELWDEVHIPI